ncbi:MAG: outer membrane lipid asymmetry maintenance protein MlaD [Gammaproteobacteria bacterium]|nr:MAG: outer membrane lipid asymmetry maintenance protein MlaD [Gammaproteobacteria bacterium]
MNSRAVEIAVGFFVLLFLAAMLLLAMKVSNLTSFSGTSGYTVTARFENVGGLRVRAPVSASGVRVGQVSAIEYDPESYEAKVTMTIDNQFDAFPLDTTASIYTAGLLGEQYIGLEPGAEEDVIVDGDEFSYTQEALVLERLIGQVLFNRSGGG